MSDGIWGRLGWQGLFGTSFSVVATTTTEENDSEQQQAARTTKGGEEESFFLLRNHQKLEEDNKSPSLDPQRNHPHHRQLHHHQQQTHLHLHQEENEEEEEDQEEEEEEQQNHQHPQQQYHHHHHQQQQQQQQQQEQGFHGFYHLHQPTTQQQQQQHQQQQNLIYGGVPVPEEPLLLNTQNPPKKRSYFPSSSSSATFNNEYARFGEKMEETQNRQQQSSRLGLVRGGGTGGGEIIEVQGGHIVRSTGRKDRHSKVCTAKGPRDRRVRLSAHTAIQFYDVQDRLGYDRPSKAVDWLMKNAKTAIDELAELPPWHPTATVTPATVKSSEQDRDEENRQREIEGFVGSSKMQMDIEENAPQYVFHHHHHLQQQQQQQNNNPSNNNNLLPPSLDSDAIADTIKSFFPMAAAHSGSVSSASSIHFPNYQPPDLLSRTSSQSQDLRLSLQSFKDPMLLHQHHQHHHSNPSNSSEQALFSTAFDAGSGSSSWSDQRMSEMGRFQRMIAWNPNTDSSGGDGGGFVFNSPPPPPQPVQTLFASQNPFFSQRGPLQSSNSPSIRAWNIDPSMVGATDHYQNLNTVHHHQSSSISGTGFTSGFRIPARIQGEEEHDAAAASNKQQSSASRH